MLESQYYQVYKDQGDGFVVLQLIGENFNEQPPTTEQLAGWVANYGLTFPVLADPYWQVGGPYGNGYIPFYWVLDQELIIRQKGNTLSYFKNKIEDLLGI